jgi:hypothetical protein
MVERVIWDIMLIIYGLGVMGFAAWEMIEVIRGRYDVYFEHDKQERSHSNTFEVLVTVTFLTLGWPIPVIFWLVYVPIHDHLAGRAWKKYSESDEAWWKVIKREKEEP